MKLKPNGLDRVAKLAATTGVDILDSGTFFQRKAKEMSLSAYNRSEIDKRAKQICREAKIILAHIRNYDDDKQAGSLNAVQAIRLHLQTIEEYLK